MEVVLVPVASMFTQPCCLGSTVSVAQTMCFVWTYRNGPDEEAARGEVEVLRRRMLLWLSTTGGSTRFMAITSFCAVNESGDKFAISGWRCQECGRWSGIASPRPVWDSLPRCRSFKVAVGALKRETYSD